MLPRAKREEDTRELSDEQQVGVPSCDSCRTKHKSAVLCLEACSPCFICSFTLFLNTTKVGGKIRLLLVAPVTVPGSVTRGVSSDQLEVPNWEVQGTTLSRISGTDLRPVCLRSGALTRSVQVSCPKAVTPGSVLVSSTLLVVREVAIAHKKSISSNDSDHDDDSDTNSDADSDKGQGQRQ